MEAEDLPHSLHPGFEPEQEQERPKRSYSSVLGILWLLGMLSLAAAFGVVSRYFDASERLNSLVLQKKALPLREWTLQGFNCPTFYSEIDSCKELRIDLGDGRSARKVRTQFPLSIDLRSRLDSMNERPTLLAFSYSLSEHEKLWLSARTSNANKEWPSQAQLVSLGSFECEAKNPGGDDFDPRIEPDKLSCFTQSRFEAMKAIPESNRIEYYIAVGPGQEIGPPRWPLVLAENQYMHEILSLDQLTLSANVLWNLISLLMPIFVIAFRFVFKNEKTLNTLADYSVALVCYALCIITLQQSSFISSHAHSMMSALCILLEGIVLTLLVRYAYCVSSGVSWSPQATILVSAMSAIFFIVAFAISKQPPMTFLLKSHQWRDSLGSGFALAALFFGIYNRFGKSESLGGLGHSNFSQASDDFGSPSYFIRISCAGIPLMIFGMSNLRELVNPTMKVLKWEDLLFLPSQTAVMAFFLGIRTTSTLKYGKSMKERLELLFSGILNLQRAVTPLEAVESTVKCIRETLPSAAESNVEYIEHKKWATEQIQNHIALSHRTLYIPLNGSISYKGMLRFEPVLQENLSEEEEHIISTLASALAVNLENQESASNLEKMHQASLRFVPHDFLRLLKSESLIDFNLGDHVELRMAVMFADIRNFTQISEGMTPSQNFEFINGFLTQIAPVIKHHGGFIDKYIGDAIMALFPESPVHAVRCAIDIQIALRSFNDRWLGLINQEIRVGIGVHHGPMVLGIVGHAERLAGTVMSDAVNLASRLENLTKKYVANIIVSEDVLQHMSPAESKEFNLNMLDSVQVKGRISMVTIYEVVVPDEKQGERLRAS